jgi:microcystin-dependent protein
MGKGSAITGMVVAWAGYADVKFPGGVGAGEFTGWYVCDGRNGTIDLRGRFIVGKSNTHTGGNSSTVINSVSYSAHTNDFVNDPNFNGWGEKGGETDVALTVSQMPSHSHSASASASVNDPGHNHDSRAHQGGSGSQRPISGLTTNSVLSTRSTTTETTGISVSVSVTNGDTGGGNAHENLPPYFTLVYIMYLP